jgi:acyl-lipid omega-6 desaturase (Delta-12 desaturase)
LETGLSSEELLHQPVFSEQDRRGYAHRLLLFPVALFVGLAATYVGLLTLLLAVPFPLGMFLAIPCGMLIGILFIVGHDAAHNSFTRSRALNQVIGRLAFLPSLHAFSLWDLSHNRTHHFYNNVRGVDYVWEPMTPREYRALGAAGRAMYRFYRTPVGVPFYYLVALWARRMIVPWPSIFARVSRVPWLDAALVAGFLLLQIVGVVMVGARFGNAPATSVTTGVLLPFLIWNGFMSFVVFLHHTHPAIEWYSDKAERARRMGGLMGTARVIFPTPIRQLLLGIMDHNAHHFASGVPLYHLPRMQAAIEAQDDLIAWRMSWGRFTTICRECKLYDYDTKRWLTFTEDES